MTLKEKIGQLFMLGFEGKTPSRSVRRMIRDFHVGGVIFFSRNLSSPAQVVKLTNALQSLSPKMPLFLSVDQEGGRVSRLPKGFTVFPSGAVLAEGHSTAQIYRVAEATARELRSVGINMNLAPVLDVNTNPANPVIGDRAFGSDPVRVSTVGLTVIAGLQDNQIIACGKHFPGHGDTSADSHRELPVVRRDLRHIRDVELRPFLHAVQNGLAAIMTAHVRYPSLDPENPATLSRSILSGLLREKMEFKGIIVTDDLEMKAITDHWAPGEAAVRALEAGADLLLICHQEAAQVAAVEGVVKAVKKGRLSEARIEQSLLRILQAKEKYLIPFQPAAAAQARQVTGNASHRELLKEVGGVQAAAPRRVKG